MPLSLPFCAQNSVKLHHARRVPECVGGAQGKPGYRTVMQGR